MPRNLGGATANPSAEDMEDDELNPGPTKDGGMIVDMDEVNREAGDKKDERRARSGPPDRDRELLDNGGGLDSQETERQLEERRARRRDERQEKKTEQQRREEGLKREVTELRETLGQVQKQMGARQGEDARETVGRIDAEMSERKAQYEQAKVIKAQAFERAKDDPAGSAKAAVEADEAMTAARERFNQLSVMRDRVVEHVENEARRPQVSAELKRHAADFVGNLGDWYDPKGGNRDSAAVAAIDRKMSADGWNPNTKGYWEELEERVRNELPHRFKSGNGASRDRDRGDDDRPQRRSHVGAGGRESGNGGGGRQLFTLSKEQVSAIKEAGMWDDPKAKASMIRRYQQQAAEAARNK